MTHKKNNSNPGIWIVVWIVALVGIAYLASPQWREIFARSNSSTQIGRSLWTNQWYGWGCGGGSKTTTTAASCGAGWGCGWGWGWGCSMMGNRKPTNTTPTNNTIDVNTAYENVQVSEDGSNIVPEKINLTAGKNYKLIITPTSDGLWCKYAMTIPGLDNNAYDIKKGIPITITINNAKSGTYNVVCTAMWMYIWTIIIQ